MIDFPIITESQVAELEGKSIKIGSKRFQFGVAAETGGQAFAVPLLDTDGVEAAYFRILKPVVLSAAYLHRLQWMVGQKLHRKHRVFAAAPQMFWSSLKHGRPDRISFEFVGTIHGLAKGISWKSWKSKCAMAEILQSLGKPFLGEPTPCQRVAFAKSLIRLLANLECFGKNGFVHGDLSDGNLILNQETMEVSLIDFDAFVFDSPTLQKTKLTTREFGSKGTPGYIPKWFRESTSPDDFPLGDRFSRDILLIEILGFCEGDPEEISPLYWSDQEEFLDSIAELANSLGLQHLTQMSVFELSEEQRPSSFSLAQQLGLSVENNVGEKLADPPVELFRTQPEPGVDARQNETSVSRVPSPWINALRSLDWQELGKLALLAFDRRVQQIGDIALEFLKAASLWLLGIAGVCVWIWMMIGVLLNVSVPANLILVGLIFAFPIWFFSRYLNKEENS